MTEPTIANISSQDVDLVTLMREAYNRLPTLASGVKYTWLMNRIVLVMMYWMSVLEDTTEGTGFELEPIVWNAEASENALTYQEA